VVTVAPSSPTKSSTRANGLTAAPALTITDSTGSGATATAVVTAGAVTQVTPGSAGSGYSSTPRDRLGWRQRRRPPAAAALPATTEETLRQMFSVHQQYLDLASGFHVIELRDERGNRHMVQLAVGHDACPACGAVHPKTTWAAWTRPRRSSNQHCAEYVAATDAETMPANTGLTREMKSIALRQATRDDWPRILELHREHQAAQGTNYELPWLFGLPSPSPW